MPTFNQAIREIRQTVYGRDMRGPIADAVERIDRSNRKEVREYAEAAISHCDEIDASLTVMNSRLQQAVSSITMEPLETWYTYDYRDIELQDLDENDKLVEVVTESMSAEVTDNDDYLLTDSVSDDYAESLGDDYLWTVPNPITETHVHHGEDYMMIITRINGT